MKAEQDRRVGKIHHRREVDVRRQRRPQRRRKPRGGQQDGDHRGPYPAARGGAGYSLAGEEGRGPERELTPGRTAAGTKGGAKGFSTGGGGAAGRQGGRSATKTSHMSVNSGRKEGALRTAELSFQYKLLEHRPRRAGRTANPAVSKTSRKA